jgi:hypothetical protein
MGHRVTRARSWDSLEQAGNLAHVIDVDCYRFRIIGNLSGATRSGSQGMFLNLIKFHPQSLFHLEANVSLLAAK